MAHATVVLFQPEAAILALPELLATGTISNPTRQNICVVGSGATSGQSVLVSGQFADASEPGFPSGIVRELLMYRGNDLSVEIFGLQADAHTLLRNRPPPHKPRSLRGVLSSLFSQTTFDLLFASPPPGDGNGNVQ